MKRFLRGSLVVAMVFSFFGWTPSLVADNNSPNMAELLPTLLQWQYQAANFDPFQNHFKSVLGGDGGQKFDEDLVFGDTGDRVTDRIPRTYSFAVNPLSAFPKEAKEDEKRTTGVDNPDLKPPDGVPEAIVLKLCEKKSYIDPNTGEPGTRWETVGDGLEFDKKDGDSQLLANITIDWWRPTPSPIQGKVFVDKILLGSYELHKATLHFQIWKNIDWNHSGGKHDHDEDGEEEDCPEPSCSPYPNPNDGDNGHGKWVADAETESLNFGKMGEWIGEDPENRNVRQFFDKVKNDVRADNGNKFKGYGDWEIEFKYNKANKKEAQKVEKMFFTHNFMLDDKTPPQIHAKPEGFPGVGLVALIPPRRSLNTMLANPIPPMLPEIWTTGASGYGTSGDINLADELYFWDNWEEANDSDPNDIIRWQVFANQAAAGIDPDNTTLDEIGSGTVENWGPAKFIFLANHFSGAVPYKVEAVDKAGNKNIGNIKVREDDPPGYNMGENPEFGRMMILDDDYPNLLLEVVSDKDPDNSYFFPKVKAEPFPDRIKNLPLRDGGKGHSGPQNLPLGNHFDKDYIKVYPAIFFTGNPPPGNPDDWNADGRNDRIFLGNLRDYEKANIPFLKYSGLEKSYSVADFALEDYGTDDNFKLENGNLFMVKRFNPFSNQPQGLKNDTPENRRIKRRKAMGFGSRMAVVFRENNDDATWVPTDKNDGFALEEDVRYTFRFYAWDNTRLIYLPDRGKPVDAGTGIARWGVNFHDPLAKSKKYSEHHPNPLAGKTDGFTLAEESEDNVERDNTGFRTKQVYEFNYVFRNPTYDYTGRSEEGGSEISNSLDFDKKLPWIEFWAQDFTPFLMERGLFGDPLKNEAAKDDFKWSINRRVLRVYLPVRDVRVKVRTLDSKSLKKN